MTDYNRNLNGLRGLCAFLVFLRHIWAGPRLEGWWGDGLPDAALFDFLFDSLQCAVEIFFMISGFLITQSLLRAPSIGHFLLHRVLRIYPVFLATHLMLFTLGPALHYKLLDGIDAPHWLWLFVTNGLLLPGMVDLPIVQSNAWSLSYEAAFYLFSVLAWRLGRLLPPAPRAVAIALAAALACFAAPRGIFFAAGALVFLLDDRARAIGRRPWLPATVLLPLLFVLLQASLQAPIDEMRLGYAIGCVLGILLFARLVHGRMPLLRSRVMQYLGDISYSFYLWHPFAYFIGKRLVHGTTAGLPPALQVLLLFLVALPLALALSHASHRLIERAATGALRRRLEPRAALPSTGLAG